MSMFSSLSRFVQTLFNTATATIDTMGKGLDIANHWVAENHEKITQTTTTSAQMAVAEFNSEVAQRLNASEELNAQYLKVVKNWRKPK